MKAEFCVPLWFPKRLTTGTKMTHPENGLKIGLVLKILRQKARYSCLLLRPKSEALSPISRPFAR